MRSKRRGMMRFCGTGFLLFALVPIIQPGPAGPMRRRICMTPSVSPCSLSKREISTGYGSIQSLSARAGRNTKSK